MFSTIVSCSTLRIGPQEREIYYSIQTTETKYIVFLRKRGWTSLNHLCLTFSFDLNSSFKLSICFRSFRHFSLKTILIMICLISNPVWTWSFFNKVCPTNQCKGYSYFLCQTNGRQIRAILAMLIEVCQSVNMFWTWNYWIHWGVSILIIRKNKNKYQ